MNFPDNLGFKKSSSKDFVTMMTIEKLERIIPSVMTILEIERGDLDFGLEKFGNHVTEQQIGQIRVWCKFDHHPK